MNDIKRKNFVWEETQVDVTDEANFIWSIANKLRGSYMPDKYGDVVIPMTILRRFECALQHTKAAVVAKFEENPAYPAKAMCRISGFQFYNTSRFTLKELCNDADNLAEQFKAYLAGFSANVQDIFNELELSAHIDKMDKDNCLLPVVKAFSELDLSPDTFDSIKMGYIFENLIGRFFQNVDAGQFYTGRDIIQTLVNVLLSEGCDDIFDDGKVVTVCDQACGTGGMLSTAFSHIKHFNPSADVRLFGQEFMGPSYAVGLAEMLIKGQNAENFRHADTFKEDCFPNIKMRFLLENPPFGTPWAGKDAKLGQEDAVRAEAERPNSRWPAGLPSGGDGQLLFMQSAIDKMDDMLGRAAIIENGSPLFTGGVSSGESQIRKWMLEQDLIEAIIALPTDLFYNTGIQTYAWILSKNKRLERKGKIQLIDASGFCHKMRKPLGNKRNEFLPEDRAAIVKLYCDFPEENEFSKVYDNEYFMYREYTVMQPMQRSYAITEERIRSMLDQGVLSGLYDQDKVDALLAEQENLQAVGKKLPVKEQRKLDAYEQAKPMYDAVLAALNGAVSDEKHLSPESFRPVLLRVLRDIPGLEKKIIDKVMDGLSEMDKTAKVQTDKKGNVVYDKSTKDTETVPFTEDIDTYMAREVLPFVPDAAVIGEPKEGAEIGFTKEFYKYTPLEPFDSIMQRIEARQEALLQQMEEFSKGGANI